jgi:5-methylcytosine-specific restriction endonuclease McrA
MRYTMSVKIDMALYRRDNNIRGTRKIPDEYLFTKKSMYTQDCVKTRLITDNLISYNCQICHSPPEWRGEKLVLVLDHINGINDDNRVENLRFLCPNCNSQTETFSRNYKHRKTILCEHTDTNVSLNERIIQPLIFGD